MLAQKEKKGAVKNYAKYCLRTLEGMLASGASGFVPSVEEIQAYKERPPILATVELVDGNTLTEELPVTPDLNVGKVVEICHCTFHDSGNCLCLRDDVGDSVWRSHNDHVVNKRGVREITSGCGAAIGSVQRIARPRKRLDETL